MLFVPERNPFTDRVCYNTSVKLVYSYTFSEITRKLFSKIFLELAFTFTFEAYCTMGAAGRPNATALTAAMGMARSILFHTSLRLMPGRWPEE